MLSRPALISRLAITANAAKRIRAQNACHNLQRNVHTLGYYRLLSTVNGQTSLRTLSRRLSYGGRLPLGVTVPFVRHYGFYEEFKKNLRKGVEENPELKKSLDDLAERQKVVSESAPVKTLKKAGAAVAKGAGKASTATGQFVGKVGDKVKDTVEDIDEAIFESERLRRISRVQKRLAEIVAKPFIAIASTPPGKKLVQAFGWLGDELAKDGTDKGIFKKPGAIPKPVNPPAEQPVTTSTSTSSSSSSSSSVPSPDQSSPIEPITSSTLDESTLSAEPVHQPSLSHTSSTSEPAQPVTPQQPPLTPTGPPPPPTSSLMVYKRRRTYFEQQWESLKEKAEGNPFFRATFSIGEKVASGMSGAVENVGDRVFGETETAMAIREIKERDPEFDTPSFLKFLKEDLIPYVTDAFFKGDLKALKPYVGEDTYRIVFANVRERQTEGFFIESKIIEIRDVELIAGKLMEPAPVLVVTFICQQTNCIRNLKGEIVEGAVDDIQDVFYAWALARDRTQADMVWQVLEMHVRATQSTV